MNGFDSLKVQIYIILSIHTEFGKCNSERELAIVLKLLYPCISETHLSNTTYNII